MPAAPHLNSYKCMTLLKGPRHGSLDFVANVLFPFNNKKNVYRKSNKIYGTMNWFARYRKQMKMITHTHTHISMEIGFVN